MPFVLSSFLFTSRRLYFFSIRPKNTYCQFKCLSPIKNKPRKHRAYGVVEWSRGDSNSRPNKQFNSFLHAYLPIVFRAIPGRQLPSSTLSSIKIHDRIKALLSLCLLLRCLLLDRRKPRLSGGIMVSCLA